MPPTSTVAPTPPRHAVGARLSLAAGPVAAVLLFAVTTVDSATRPGYDPWRHWISHLALGDRAVLATATLLVSGALITVYAHALRRRLPASRSARWTARLVLLAGVALLAAAVFPIDPGMDYPPGVAASHSVRGSLHDIAGALLFASLTGAAALLGRSLRGSLAYAAPLGYLVAAVVAGSFVACSVLAALDFAGTWPHAPSGLLERVALFAGLGWLGGVGVHLHRHGEAVTPPEGDTAEAAAGG